MMIRDVNSVFLDTNVLVYANVMESPLHQLLIKNEIDRVPEDILPEILDFIQFLELKKEKTILAKAYQSLSERSFDKIWDNDEDAVYDKL